MALDAFEWLPPGDARPDAPIAMLVHGVMGWHRTWWRVGPALAERGWHVVAVDLRGHGHSPPIEGTVTVRDLAADVAEVIEGRGRTVDLLLGHSLGGAVALELAVGHPELAGRLVLEDPPAVNRVGDSAWLDTIAREVAAARHDFEGEVERAQERNPTWLAEDARQDIKARSLADGPGIIASFGADIGMRVADVLPDLELPTLLILADPNLSVYPEPIRQRTIDSLPPNVRHVVIAAGHTVHRDRFDEYLAAVLDWAGGPRPSPARV
jgi:pimeloyl-ACP methyl ester carboxylesterase